MTDDDHLAEQFETHRAHLRAVGVRMLGSTAEAEDAVQEAWLRLHRSDTTAIDNMGGWLTTVVSRVCLDMLRRRATRREDPLDEPGHDVLDVAPAAEDPADQAALADSVGAALVVVLESLGPAERLAFVLHDMFAVPFGDIAAILEVTPATARQLASRARRRVQGADASGARGPRRELVEAFLAASRDGRFSDLVALLAPDVVLHADPVAVAVARANLDRGAPRLEPEIRGATAVAEVFSGRARSASLLLVDGVVEAGWARGGKARAVWTFTVVDGRIAAIAMTNDRATIDALEVEVLT